MFSGILQFYYLSSIILNGTKPAVDLKFRPPVNYRYFYHIVETDRFIPETGKTIERREIESVEKITETEPYTIQILNLKAKIKPYNWTKHDRLMKRPHFDRLVEFELPGDFRSREHPFGYKWMLFPSPESLLVPKLQFYEGQKWAVKIAGGNYDVHFELLKVHHENHTAIVSGYNGTCIHDSEGRKTWNGTWTVDTRTGAIKQLQLQVDHAYESPKKVIRTKINKVLTREADEHMVFDYEIDEAENEEL